MIEISNAFPFHFSHSRKMIHPRCSVRRFEYFFFFFFFFLFFHFNTKFLVILYYKYTCLLFHSSWKKILFYIVIYYSMIELAFAWFSRIPYFYRFSFLLNFSTTSRLREYRATVIRSLSKVARGYLATNTGWLSTTRQASSMASAVLTALRHFSKILRLPLTNISYLFFLYKMSSHREYPQQFQCIFFLFSCVHQTQIRIRYKSPICYFIFNSILILKIHPL